MRMLVNVARPFVARCPQRRRAKLLKLFDQDVNTEHKPFVVGPQFFKFLLHIVKALGYPVEDINGRTRDPRLSFGWPLSQLSNGDC